MAFPRLTSFLSAMMLFAVACSSPSNGTERAGTSTVADPPAVAETESDGEPEVQPDPDRESDHDFAEVGPLVESFVADNGLNGAGLIVVHRDDGVIYHEHWGEFSEDRVSLIASSTKMITAGVLLKLQDEGLLDIDEPVAEQVEWGDANPDITPAQLLSNSSGLVGLAPNPVYSPYLCQFIAAGTLQGCAESIFITDRDDDRVIEPDTEFRYGGAQWQVAGAVAEIVSGKSWAELIDEIYVEPCELDGLAYNNHFGSIGAGFGYPAAFEADPSVLAPTDNPNMEGGAYVTTGDYGTLLLMHLRDGVCGDTQVLSPEALALMHDDRVERVYGGDAQRPDLGYGLGWWVDRDSGRISDPGAYGSVPWLDLDDGYGAFLVVEATSAVGNELAELLYDVIDDAVVPARP
ncbi:MAG: beta-lactamase family protein [Acidimicrobiales bacterium]|nr:beta-lactamase family protein [Acidimicrobiales bacterium]